MSRDRVVGQHFLDGVLRADGNRRIKG